jgi:ornithine carbamoyltransferase
MAKAASIPVINGLSDQFHPCQTLADLLTIQEHFGTLDGIKLAYIGDGNNILQSFFPVLEKTGLKLSYACPEGYGPKPYALAKYQGQHPIEGFTDPYMAVRGADVIYTDVWTSMGFESESAGRDKAFAGFQVNHALLAAAGDKPQVMHCMPMVRGKEIEYDLPDSPEHSLIFQQSENRLHVQKALLVGLLQRNAIRSVAKPKLLHKENVIYGKVKKQLHN